MKRSTLSWVALAIAAPLLAAGLPTVTANAAVPGKAKVAHAAAASHSAAGSSKVGATPAALTGYQQVLSESVTDPAGSQVSGDATCPLGTRAIGGGAVIAGFSLDENLNGSIPLNARTWRVYVNNASAEDGTFVVYAVCVAGLRGYSRVFGTGVDNPAGTQVTATVACPAGKVPLGGGGLGSSSDVQVNLNTTIPQSGGWRVDVNNNSADGDSATAYAVCGTTPAKYAQVSSHAATTVGAGVQTSTQVVCPAGTLVFSGGMFSGSSATTFDLNSSFPNSTKIWKAYADNNSASSSTIRAYAVCGRSAA